MTDKRQSILNHINAMSQARREYTRYRYVRIYGHLSGLDILDDTKGFSQEEIDAAFEGLLEHEEVVETLYKEFSKVT